MKPILIIRVPKETIEYIPEIRQTLAKTFKQYKVYVISDNAEQMGINFSIINTTLYPDEILEKQVLKLTPSLGLIWFLIKNRIKRFFYFGK